MRQPIFQNNSELCNSVALIWEVCDDGNIPHNYTRKQQHRKRGHGLWGCHPFTNACRLTLDGDEQAKEETSSIMYSKKGMRLPLHRSQPDLDRQWDPKAKARGSCFILAIARKKTAVFFLAIGLIRVRNYFVIIGCLLNLSWVGQVRRGS